MNVKDGLIGVAAFWAFVTWFILMCKFAPVAMGYICAAFVIFVISVLVFVAIAGD
jgi:hypothetical protein